MNLLAEIKYYIKMTKLTMYGYYLNVIIFLEKKGIIKSAMVKEPDKEADFTEADKSWIGNIDGSKLSSKDII